MSAGAAVLVMSDADESTRTMSTKPAGRNEQATADETDALADTAPEVGNGAGARGELTHEQIAALAFEIFEAEGGGDDVDHWLRAERALAGDRQQSASWGPPN